MHDLRMIREQIDVLRDGMRRRGKLETLAPFIDRAAEVDTERRMMIQAVEERKASRNAMTQEVA
ncbi:MAG: serine--tRNA ligase, partial [Gemmatimonadaceae bacterium]